jgi:anti-sigma factor (TIGR02949 family)
MTHDFEDCTEVIRNLYAFHDHELTDAEADEIRAHLLACEPCLDHYQVENALRVLIRRCCSEEKAPETLRMRVRATWTKTVIVTEIPD